MKEGLERWFLTSRAEANLGPGPEKNRYTDSQQDRLRSVLPSPFKVAPDRWGDGGFRRGLAWGKRPKTARQQA